jgi:hypothetical protein
VRAARGCVARPERFELPAPRFEAWCSIQLSYGREPRIRPQPIAECHPRAPAAWAEITAGAEQGKLRAFRSRDPHPLPSTHPTGPANRKRRPISPVTLLLMPLVLALTAAGCATRTDQIALERIVCCDADVSGIRTYRVEADGVPRFLEPYFVDGVVAVLQGKGLTRARGEPADAVVRLTYNQWDIYTREQIPINEVIDAPPEELEVREPEDRGDYGTHTERVWFLPRIRAEVRLASGDDVIWSGVLSRVHRFTIGEYMHDRSRIPIYYAFSELFEAWPALTE